MQQGWTTGTRQGLGWHCQQTTKLSDKLGTRYEKGYVTTAMIDVKNLRANDVAFELYYSHTEYVSD